MIKLKNILTEGVEKQLEKIVKRYGGVYCKKCKGVGIWFKFPIKDYPSAGTQIVTKAGRDILKKETENATRRANKAAKQLDRLHTTAPGPDKQKTIEDYEISNVSPSGVHGSIWLWVMV